MHAYLHRFASVEEASSVVLAPENGRTDSDIQAIPVPLAQSHSKLPQRFTSDLSDY